MRTYMSENKLFDHWLQQKSEEILSKIDKEKISTEDKLILTLKAQTNHFHHMDIEFRDDFKKIDSRFNDVDKKFERLYSFLMWGFGLIITLIFGLYIKLYIG